MKKFEFLGICVAVASLSGCLSYTGITGDADEQVDEGNKAFVAAAQKAYVARLKAPARPVVITEAPAMALFLGPQSVVGHPVCNDLNVRKELAMMFKSQLRERVGTIKDFKLVDETVPALEVIGEGDGIAPENYRLYYNITGVELKENSAGSLATGLIGSQLGGYAGRTVADQKFWDGIAKVEVRLMKPNGTDCVFSFVGEGKYTKMVDQYTPVSKELLLEAVKIAAANAMEGYNAKFGPQMYVTDTCQDGRFARLSAGAQFGIVPNQKVEFYRNVVRESATGEEEVSRRVVATGVVGALNAPVEDDGAWVLVDDYDEKSRKVFRWTSARILKSGTNK